MENSNNNKNGLQDIKNEWSIFFKKKDSELNDIRNFLKRGTGHFKVYELYNQFKALKAYKNSKISYEAFELHLLKLNKKIIRALREDCYQYIAVNGAESYPKYIREKEFVSRKFWKNICKTVPVIPVVPTTVALPTPNPPLHPVKLKAAEPPINTVEDPPVVPSLNEDCFQYIRKNGVDSYQNYIREKKFIPKRFWNKICKEKLSDNPDIPNIEDDYYKLLPLDWVKMSFSDRIEFTKKVQHPDFLKYIFKLDSKLEGYLKKIRHNPTDLKLYVNIFTIPSETYSEEAKSLLKLFVDALNMTGRARLQFVQCTKPDIIEIREVK